RLTDSQGRTVSFKDTIIIMTSNAGSTDAEANVGFGATLSGKTHSVLDQLGNYFKPEFLNRFDDIVEFKPLSKDDLLKIVSLMINDTNNNLKSQGLTIHVTDPVKESLSLWVTIHPWGHGHCVGLSRNRLKTVWLTFTSTILMPRNLKQGSATEKSQLANQPRQKPLQKQPRNNPIVED
ncbi:ATP-dependent clp protease ATP-binding subunit, partial [Lacticaseibacillus rhamnosus MTCC 5462]